MSFGWCAHDRARRDAPHAGGERRREEESGMTPDEQRADALMSWLVAVESFRADLLRLREEIGETAAREIVRKRVEQAKSEGE
jgi:hypothetical protein